MSRGLDIPGAEGSGTRRFLSDAKQKEQTEMLWDIVDKWEFAAKEKIRNAGCGCTTTTEYVAGSGWERRHKHPVRGPKTCFTCSAGACPSKSDLDRENRRTEVVNKTANSLELIGWEPEDAAWHAAVLALLGQLWDAARQEGR